MTVVVRCRMISSMRKCPKCGHRDPAAVKASRKYQRKVRRELLAARKAKP